MSAVRQKHLAIKQIMYFQMVLKSLEKKKTKLRGLRGAGTGAVVLDN